MDKIGEYIATIGAANLILAVAVTMVGMIALLSVPAKWSLSAMLVIFPSWMLLGLLEGIGGISLFAKATGALAMLVLLGFAWRAKYPYAPSTQAHMLYYALGVIGVLSALLGPPPVVLPFVLKAQWLILATAALAVLYTRDPEDESLQRILLPLMIGFGIATFILAIPALTGSGIRAGINRYFPWGANPNQAGPYLVVAFALGLVELRKAPKIWRPAAVLTAAAAIGLILLTKSRSNLAVAIMISLPVLFSMWRRPVTAVFASILGGGTLYYFGRKYFSEQSFSRFLYTETTRDEIAQGYFEQIQQSPVFGRMMGNAPGTVDVVETHTHNIYIQLLVEGGVIYLTPLVLIVALSLYGGARLVLNPKRFHLDPLVAQTAFFWMIGACLHGIANNNSYYGTSAFAWTVVFFGAFCMQGLSAPQNVMDSRIQMHYRSLAGSHTRPLESH